MARRRLRRGLHRACGRGKVPQASGGPRDPAATGVLNQSGLRAAPDPPPFSRSGRWRGTGGRGNGWSPARRLVHVAERASLRGGARGVVAVRGDRGALMEIGLPIRRCLWRVLFIRSRLARRRPPSPRPLFALISRGALRNGGSASRRLSTERAAQHGPSSSGDGAVEEIRV